MKFEQFENQVRSLISQNKLEETIKLLSDYLTEDSDLDEITIQSSKYHSVLEKQRRGTAGSSDVEVELNKLNSNILQLLRSKKEYLKYKKQTFGESNENSENDSEKIKVFFSVASPYNNKQQIYINELVKYFHSNGINLETLKEWNDNDPIMPILKELKKSNGCFVLALERYFVSEGSEKRGSEQESLLKDMSFTSPWLHIEAAIARSLDLPLIIFKDKSLRNEGLIHNDKQEWGIVRIDESNMQEIFEYPVKNFILNWINQVKMHSKNKYGR
ncbi:MAG: hypothetical protein IPP06_15815 [Saprospiraceae bacterium]|nr:hypothetical protein [Candidatus Vicinibacter affinis]